MHKETKRIIIQITLFIATFISTTIAGVEWAYNKSIYMMDENGIDFNSSYSWSDFYNGLQFSVPLLLILTVHEFGHYFMAMYHKVKASLPYYIPIPPIPFLPLSIGTMGAVIRLRSKPTSNLQNFDIGLAGPLAGFIVAVVVMIYGFSTLPPAEYVFQFHPEYKEYGLNYADHVYTPEYIAAQGRPVVDVTIGKNLIFWIAEKFVDDPSRIPNSHELMHYPVLLAAYIALFFTCLNLLPIGQLDGGHVVYGLFGFKKHKVIATAFYIALMFYACLGLPFIDLSLPFIDKDYTLNSLAIAILAYLAFLYFAFSGLLWSKRNTIMIVLIVFAIQFSLKVFAPGIQGYTGWIVFGLLLGRLIGVYHPPSEIESPLDSKRIVLGWTMLIIFILCFSPAPIEVEFIVGNVPAVNN
jgi:membrane-associated protease RseP (regulator of RpoE activity)